MTEAEWLQGAEPFPLIDYLEYTHRVLQFKAGRRKARLLACAWCRPLLAYLPGAWGGAVIELVERFADGLISKADLAAAREVARENGARVTEDFNQAFLGNRSVLQETWLSVWAAGAMQSLPLESSPSMLGNLGIHLTQAARLAPALPNRSEIIREVFGSPFAPVKVAPAWLRRNDGAARKLAATIYDNRAFGEAPVLADALEDAGCADEAVLGHLRGPGPHVRGCWVVDLLLGKG